MRDYSDRWDWELAGEKLDAVQGKNTYWCPQCKSRYVDSGEGRLILEHSDVCSEYLEPEPIDWPERESENGLHPGDVIALGTVLGGIGSAFYIGIDGLILMFVLLMFQTLYWNREKLKEGRVHA